MNKVKIKKDDLRSLYIEYDDDGVIQSPIELNGKKLSIGSGGGGTIVADEVKGLTNAPTEDNTSGNYILVVLTEEPSTYYNGYIYIILGE